METVPRIITSVGKAVLGVNEVAGGRVVEVCRSVCSRLVVSVDGVPANWLHAVCETSKANKIRQLQACSNFMSVTIPGLFEFFKPLKSSIINP
jgi:hypothetical protein